MTSSAIYENLPARHIRVLDIAADTVEQPLRGKLRQVDLDDAPTFTALSYVWGVTAPVPDTLLCGEIAIEVTSNCYSALRNLRQKLGAFTIWVDAICINQENEEEKSAQIPLMSNIYAKASQVYVWLGPATTTSDRIAKYLSTAGLHRFTSGKGATTEYHTLRASISLAFYWARPGIHPYPLEYWFGMTFGRPWFSKQVYAFSEELIDFLDQEWLNRVWTYQEILLATNPVLVFGLSHISWESFTFAIVFLSSNGNLHLGKRSRVWESIALDKERLMHASTLEAHKAWIPKVHNTSFWVASAFCVSLEVAAFTMVFVSKGNIILLSVGALTILFTLLPWFLSALKVGRVNSAQKKSPAEALPISLYKRKARDPKDMAFGVWGVLLNRGASLSTPLYSVELHDIYRTLTIHLLQVTSSTDILLLASIKGMASCPSWVPDWSAISPTWSVVLNRADLAALPPDIRDWGLIDAIFNERAVNDLSLTDVLTVQAHDLGNLTTCSTFRRTAMVYSEEERPLHLANLRMMRECIDWTSRNTPWMLARLGLSKRSRRWASWRRMLCKRISWDDTPEWFREHQIRVSNAIAQSEYTICRARVRSQEVIAISRQAMVDDRVVRVKGMVFPLVMRHVGPDNAVRIIGPFDQGMTNWHNMVPRINAATIEFAKYHIH